MKVYIGKLRSKAIYGMRVERWFRSSVAPDFQQIFSGLSASDRVLLGFCRTNGVDCDTSSCYLSDSLFMLGRVEGCSLPWSVSTSARLFMLVWKDAPIVE